MKRSLITIIGSFTLLANVALIVATLFTACDPQPHTRRVHHKVAVKKQEIHHTKNGRLVFQDNGIWYYYMILSMNHSGVTSGYYTDTANRSYTYYESSAVTSLPQGAWVPATTIATQSPQVGQQMEFELNDARVEPATMETEVEMTPTGEVASAGEQMEFEFNGGETNGSGEASYETTESAPSGGSESSPSSSESSSFSSESSSSSSESSSSGGGEP